MTGFVQMKNPGRITISTESQSEASSPSLPHFDDEATLLTARPVVPIDVATASERTGGLLFKAGIILAAALLGAGIAVSVVFLQNRRAPAANVVTEIPTQISTQATPVAEAESTSKPIARQSDETEAPASTIKEIPTDNKGDGSDLPPIQIKETQAATGRERSKQRAEDNEAAANHRNVVGKRSDRPAERPQAAKVRRSNDADQVVERPHDAGRIREIFEGPSPF